MTSTCRPLAIFDVIMLSFSAGFIIAAALYFFTGAVKKDATAGSIGISQENSSLTEASDVSPKPLAPGDTIVLMVSPQADPLFHFGYQSDAMEIMFVGINYGTGMHNEHTTFGFSFRYLQFYGSLDERLSPSAWSPVFTIGSGLLTIQGVIIGQYTANNETISLSLHPNITWVPTPKMRLFPLH